MHRTSRIGPLGKEIKTRLIAFSLTNVFGGRFEMGQTIQIAGVVVAREHVFFVAEQANDTFSKREKM